MKKVFGFFAALMLIGGFASAETAFGDTTNGGGNTTLTSAECSLLGNAVQINLSANVFGGYNCDDVNQDIRIGTCHVAGSRNPLTVTQDVEGSTTGETEQVVISDYRAYVASSTGGSVSAVDLGGNCTSTRLLAVSYFTDGESAPE